MELVLTGLDLRIEDVVAAARSTVPSPITVAISAPARDKLQAVRSFMDDHRMTDDAPLIYSFNTGSGSFRDRRVLVEDMAEAQRRGILAHSTGIGEPFALDATRAMMLPRVNSIASNYSGASGRHRPNPCLSECGSASADPSAGISRRI